MTETHSKAEVATVWSYVQGFLYSIALTLAAFAIVRWRWANGWSALLFLMGLASLQLIAQIVYFLQLGKRSDRQWNILVGLFALLVILIVGGGTLWIMFNLNQRVMAM